MKQNEKRPVYVKTTQRIRSSYYEPTHTFSNRKEIEHPYYPKKKIYTTTLYITVPLEYDGFFHEWGLDSDDSQEGPASFSVGIVETDSGKILTALPQEIRFKDNENT